MIPQVTLEEKDRRIPKGPGLVPYFALLSIQTAGVATLLANIVPLYRMMARDFSQYRPDASPWWAVVGILLAQAAYWFGVRRRFSPPRTQHIVLGHLVHFVARLLFVSVTASFTLMFLHRLPDLRNLSYSPVRFLIILIIFFAIFCWTLELERLAKALQAPEGGARAGKDPSEENS